MKQYFTILSFLLPLFLLANGGPIDGDDLLIHAYNLKAEIIPLKETNLHNTPYITYKWKQ